MTVGKTAYTFPLKLLKAQRQMPFVLFLKILFIFQCFKHLRDKCTMSLQRDIRFSPSFPSLVNALLSGRFAEQGKFKYSANLFCSEHGLNTHNIVQNVFLSQVFSFQI